MKRDKKNHKQKREKTRKRKIIINKQKKMTKTKNKKQIKTRQKTKWDQIEKQIYDFVYSFDEPWEGTYAILVSKYTGKVEFAKLPDASSDYWEENGWEEIGHIEGIGLDGMVIDVDYKGHKIHEQGYFDIDIPT